MRTITRWSPDTCGCIIEYAWDTDEHGDVRQHSYHATHRTCAHHAHLADVPEHHTTIQAENQRKNHVLTHSQELIAGIGPEHYRWSYDADRVLHATLDHPDLTADHKATIQAKLDAQHGPNRVIVR